MKNETELLQECKLQLEYLNEKFGETGTTNALLTKIDVVLRQPDVIKSVCPDCSGEGVVSKDQFSEVWCLRCGGTGQTVL